MRILALAAMLLFALTASVTAKEAIGFKQIELPADQGGKTLAVSMWYPTTSSGKAETVGENAIFFGLDVLLDASRAPGKNQTVTLIYSAHDEEHNDAIVLREVLLRKRRKPRNRA